jgi:cellulose synthase operon protein C
MNITRPSDDAGLSQTALEQQASVHFLSHRYKEAGDLYKELLKHSDNVYWRQQLAQCYLKRALSFAVKGQIKEAAILWENYAELAEPPLANFDDYIVWSLSTKNFKKAETAIALLTKEQLDQQYPGLAVWLGFLSLVDQPEIAAQLPQDSVFITHVGLIREALNACRENNPEQLDDILKKLPFRSAFRDLRPLLKGLMSIPASIEQTRELLTRLPEKSPYRAAADALLAYTQEGKDFADKAIHLEPLHRKIIAKAKGMSNKQIELLDVLCQNQNRLTDKLKFDLAIRYRALFGDDSVQRFCQAMLLNYPAGRKDYLKHFGSGHPFEEHRIEALLCEQNQMKDDAAFHWRQCIEALKNQGDQNDRKIALILRHMTVVALPEDAVGLLVESLNYDPADRDSFLKILKYYDEHDPDPAEYQRWLDVCLKQFPKDADFLTFAIKASTRKKAFKKTSQYAKDLLKTDPVNTLAKQSLVSSHLAHARKLIKTKKYHLVDKEIQSAGNLLADKKMRAQAELIRGFFEFAAEDKQLGLQKIADALQKLNTDPVAMHFQATMEALLLDLPVATITRQLPSVKDYLLPAQGLSRLIGLIRQYDEQGCDRKILVKALDKFKVLIKKSVQQQDYTEALLLKWSQLVDDLQHYELLRHCAKVALGQWNKPVWRYYKIYAAADGDPARVDLLDFYRLNESLDEALRTYDQRTAHLIRRFNSGIERFLNPLNFIDELVEQYEHDVQADSQDDAIMHLFGYLSDSDFLKINKRLALIMKQKTPDQVLAICFSLCLKKISPKIQDFLMGDQLFVTCAALFYAAYELQMDVEITMDDIVAYFDESDLPKSSFPFF